MVDDSWDWRAHDPQGWLDVFHEYFWITHGGNITVDPQGLIIEGHVDSRRRMYHIPMPILKVDGNFTIADNKLMSLDNAPQEVTGSFQVPYNELKSLKGGPIKVGQDYDCSHNSLTDLTHAPVHVPRYFHAHLCPLESLEGLPQGMTYCTLSNNEQRDVPLLRCLTVQGKVAITNGTTTAFDKELNAIMNDSRWHGKGKSGVLNCALELKKAGYGGNARW